MRTLIALIVGTFLVGAAPESDKIKVACVGDSNTQGAGNAYPIHLSKPLGDGYTVLNFGANGSTLARGITNGNGQGDRSYFATDFFTKAKESNPSIVVIMLGTNDSDSTSWENPKMGNRAKDHFEKDYRELIRAFKALPSKPRILTVIPPRTTDTNPFTIRGTVVRDEIAPIVRKVAKDEETELVDMFEATKAFVTDDFAKFDDKLTYDGVHATEEGGKLMADVIAKAIKNAPATKGK